MDTIKLDISEPPINNDTSSSSGGGTRSMNFGPGADLLMNHKRSNTASPSASRQLGSSSDIKELEDLESDLNELTSSLETKSPSFGGDKPKDSAFSKMFSLNTSKPESDRHIEEDTIKLDTEPISLDGISSKPPTTQSSIGKTMNADGNVSKTWDGFKSFNDIPIDPVMEPKKVALTREEELKRKFTVLRKLDALRAKGISISKDYNMDSKLEEMEGEYELLKSEKEKSNSIKFQGNMMCMCVQGLEYLNKTFDPFDVDLDGWHDQVTENINDYDEIFAELHEKYKSKATIAPELKLLFQLGGSALMVHMSNKMMSSLMPTADDVLKQNPNLMRQFMSATASSMSQQAPNFGNFMNDIMNNGPVPPQVAQQQPPSPPQQSSRPEMIPPNAHGTPRMAREPRVNDAAAVDDNFASIPIPRTQKSEKRPEMKGPSDISQLLAGLKTKKISVDAPNVAPTKKANEEKGSIISIDELGSISKDADNIPRKSKRKPRSERNTVSLGDI